MRIFLLLTFLLSIQSYAGERGGNGGGVHVCGNQVELYDFYEAKNPFLHNLKLWKSDPSQNMFYYISRLVINQSIPFIPDADVAMVDEGCSYLQVANWNERFEKVFFRKSLFEKLDGMGKAGLYVHESLYKVSRDAMVAKNSDKIRLVVAKIFSEETLTQVDIDAIWNVGPQKALQVQKCQIGINGLQSNIGHFKDISKLCDGAEAKLREDIKEFSIRVRKNFLDNLNLCLQNCTDAKEISACNGVLSIPMPVCE